MNAQTIRTALASEVETLSHEGNHGASDMLARFLRLASDAELLRFRQLLLSA
jgi:hypothetical protein